MNSKKQSRKITISNCFNNYSDLFKESGFDSLEIKGTGFHERGMKENPDKYAFEDDKN